MTCKNIKCKKEISDEFEFCPYCGRKQTVAERKKVKRPNGTGTIYKLSGHRSKPWAVVKNKQYIGYYATKAEATIALEQLGNTVITEKYNYTFSDVYEAWKNEKFRTLSKKGTEGYCSAYKHSTILYNKKFRDLKTSDFQSVIDSLAEQGKSKAVASKVKQLYSQLSQWAVREDIASKNYASFVIIEGENAKEKSVFTDEDIAKLKADNSETAQIVLLLIYTGARITELFSAKKENCFDDYIIGGIKTEAGKNRIIYVPDVARPYYKHFVELSTTTLLDGYSGNKDANNFRGRNFDGLMEKLNITGKTPHSARHTFTSQAVKNKVQPEVLQQLLGHAKYSTTIDNYSHINKNSILEEAKKIW